MFHGIVHSTGSRVVYGIVDSIDSLVHSIDSVVNIVDQCLNGVDHRRLQLVYILVKPCTIYYTLFILEHSSFLRMFLLIVYFNILHGFYIPFSAIFLIDSLAFNICIVI